MASGFHGGGGAVKTDEIGMEGNPTGCLCGTLAAGVLTLGILYGRMEPGPVLYGGISQLAAHLHRRFQEELGGKCCALLRPFYQKIDGENSCKEIYRKGAELAVEVALAAPALVPECQMPRSLQRLVKKNR